MNFRCMNVKDCFWELMTICAIWLWIHFVNDKLYTLYIGLMMWWCAFFISFWYRVVCYVVAWVTGLWNGCPELNFFHMKMFLVWKYFYFGVSTVLILVQPFVFSKWFVLFYMKFLQVCVGNGEEPAGASKVWYDVGDLFVVGNSFCYPWG